MASASAIDTDEVGERRAVRSHGSLTSDPAP